MTLPAAFVDALVAAVGAAHVVDDPAALEAASVDGLDRDGHPPDLVVRPGSTAEVACVMAACDRWRVPVVPRGRGTGYSGGAVPVRGGVVLSLQRLDRILEIDEANLLAVVEPNVITGDLQAAVERVGLFYPPDPASLDRCAIGGNVAECAGGPRAFKYGTTGRYVLGLEAVLPTGEVVSAGGRTVKNFVGYDLTQLLGGSEGTLAVVTKVVLRLLPRPPVTATLRVAFASVDAAVAAVLEIVRARVIPSVVEFVDRLSLDAVERHLGIGALVPADAGAMLLIEADGLAAEVEEQVARIAEACGRTGALEVLRAASDAEREQLWRARRELSPALRALAPLKINHDVVVPKARIPDLMTLVAELQRESGLPIPCFGHAGDGNIHVNVMVDPADAEALACARTAERRLLEGVVALGGAITGEHGIGLTKVPFIGLGLSADELALMRRIKRAFDPHGILNPGKIFPDED